MPDSTSGEVFRKLNMLENAITSHVSACGEKNKARDKWESKTDSKIDAIDVKVASLWERQIQQTAWVAGASAASTAIVTILLRIFMG